MSTSHSDVIAAIDKVGENWDQFKKTHDAALMEAEKKNEARVKELTETLEKISADLQESQKQRTIMEKRWLAHQERIEIVEAMNDRPRATVQDNARAELKATFVRALRGKFADMEANHAYQQAQIKAREVKAITIGTALDGGNAVPEEISRQVEMMVIKLSDVAAAVKNVQVGTSDYNELVSVSGTVGAWAGEATSRTTSATANVRKITPTWGELYALPKVSNWALEDIFFDVENWLVNDAGEQFANAISTAVYNGNGTNKPTGVFNATAVTTADFASPLRGAAAIQYIPTNTLSPQAVNGDDFIDLMYALNPRYRTNARWMMNTVTQGAVRKLKDSNGQYLWQQSLQLGQPDMLLGKPVGTWEDLADPTTGDGFYAVFGDFSKGYVLTSRTGLTIIRDQVTVPGHTNFYMARRVGGIVLNNDALKALKLADT